MRIIVIVSDTYRYDNLDNPGKTTPNLNEFAGTSSFFSNCYVSSFPTIPHRNDLMTGRYSFPFHDWAPLRTDEITLAQLLYKNRYFTQLIADTPHLVKRGYNYDIGFVGYHWERGQEGDIPFTRYNHEIKSVIPADKTRGAADPFFPEKAIVDLHRWTNWWWKGEEDRFAPRTAKKAMDWLENNHKCRDFLLWVDFFDPHEPWDPPEDLVRLYDPDYKGIPMMHPNYGPADAYTPEELRNLSAHYRAEAALVDKCIGRVIRKIRELEIYDDSLIIFTSDHGMYLGEHNYTGKSNLCETGAPGPWPLYNEVTHVPLIIHLPGQKSRRDYTEIVQPPDIMPTILDISGIREKTEIHGSSLAPVFKNGKWPRKYAFSSPALKDDPENELPVTTVSDTEWTLIAGGRKGQKPRLFNLREDPAQEHDVLEKNSKKAGEMAAALVKFLESLDTENTKIEALKKRLPPA